MRLSISIFAVAVINKSNACIPSRSTNTLQRGMNGMKNNKSTSMMHAYAVVMWMLCVRNKQVICNNNNPEKLNKITNHQPKQFR